jgi:cytochrome c oxidase subunit 2
MTAMRPPAPPGAARDPHASEAVAAAAERRWAVVVGIIIALLVATMVVTGLQWAAMPPSRVEAIDPRTLHVSGEFVESNLGTAVGPDGAVVVRLVAQQYSFVPACIVVPADMPVTFRGTSTDAIHGFIVGTTNANTMLIPGFVATFTTTFPKAGEALMPCHEYCGTGHEAMWAHVRVIPAADFLARARTGERLDCVAR